MRYQLICCLCCCSFFSLLHINCQAPFTLPTIVCESQADTVQHAFRFGAPTKHWQRSLALPAKGPFVEESHYLTNQDKFPNQQIYPKKVKEHIRTHLERSLKIYQQYVPEVTLDSLYGESWQQQWTPSEMGHIGQGSIGDQQLELLTPEAELWLMTMMWKRGTRPEPGTKFLLKANRKAVVVVAGYETGPGQRRFLGGLTTEVHHWLGTDSKSIIEVHSIAKQDIPVGPVVCE